MLDFHVAGNAFSETNGGIFLSSKLQGNIQGNLRMARSAFSMSIDRESKREL